MSEEMAYKKFTKVYKKGKVIFKQNSSGNEMYIVSSGKVKLYADAESGQRTVLATLKPGDHFGEMSLVDSSPRSATAIAEEDNTRLVVLDKAKFMYLISQQPEFAFAIMETLCQRIRNANLQLAQSQAKGKTRSAPA
jgi:CRP/FNR family cyclic AMP-dependent transcriptional regulator